MATGEQEAKTTKYQTIAATSRILKLRNVVAFSLRRIDEDRGLKPRDF
jgi:hypothetical protein